MSSLESEASRLLTELRILVEESGAAAASPYVDDPDYIQQYLQYKQSLPCDEYGKKMKIVREKINMVLTRKDQDHVFRICSIGCGDGLVDEDLLSTVARENPHLQIQYIGIDVSKSYCKIAQENLKPAKNVDVKIYNQDFMDFTDEPFDVVIALHSFYYLTSPDLGVKKALSLTNENGLVLAALRPYDALFKPYGVMCVGKDKRDLCYSTTLAEAMKTQGVRYTEESYTYTLDLTTCFNDNFQLPNQINILDFLAHSKLKLYSESVTKMFIAYLKSISTGKPERALIDTTVYCFCITH